MCLDEEKANSCGSDHNRISLQLNLCPQHKVDNRARPAKQHWKTKDKERLEAFSLQLESELEDVATYEELEERCLKVAEHAIGKTEQRTKTRSTPWFDKTVKAAIAERRTLSRLHRHTKEDTAAKEIAWKQYIEKKEQVRKLVAEKIATTYRQEEEHITKERKHYSERFWRYVHSLEPNQPVRTTFTLQTQSGLQLSTKEEMEAHMTTHFGALQVVHPQETTTLGPETKQSTTPADIEDFLVGPITPTELKRRIQDLKNQKATGIDDIPNEFIKAMKTNARETLRHGSTQSWIRRKYRPSGKQGGSN